MSIPTPNNYKNQLDSLIQNFNSSLNGITASFTDYKLGINKDFLKDKQNFNSVKAAIVKLQNNIQTSMETVHNKLDDLNDKISKLDKDNAILTKQTSTLNKQGLAAKGELVDQEFVTDQIFTQNIILLVLIIINIGVCLIKTYKPYATTVQNKA